MQCKEPGCDGSVVDGLCRTCGATAKGEPSPADASSRQAIIESIRRLLEPKEIAPSREDLLRASQKLSTVIPYNYDAWRLHADLLLNGIRRLQTRELQPDANFTILAIPFREDDLRDAAETALRECARFADSAERRIALIDEANRIRRMTWF